MGRNVHCPGSFGYITPNIGYITVNICYITADIDVITDNIGYITTNIGYITPNIDVITANKKVSPSRSLFSHPTFHHRIIIILLGYHHYHLIRIPLSRSLLFILPILKYGKLVLSNAVLTADCCY